jgi:hypothetical protein
MARRLETPARLEELALGKIKEALRQQFGIDVDLSTHRPEELHGIFRDEPLAPNVQGAIIWFTKRHYQTSLDYLCSTTAGFFRNNEPVVFHLLNH